MTGFTVSRASPGASHLSLRPDMNSGDVRFALRHFARRPLTTTTIVLVLSLGIGVHAAVFSLIQAVTMRPAPGVPRDPSLVRIRGKEQPEPGGKWYLRGLSYPELRDLADHRELFASVAGWTYDNVALGDSDGADDGAADVQFVTGDLFTALGVRPVLGAALPPSRRADQAEPELVAVIGYALWHDVYGASPDVVGRIIRLNGVAVQIVGVAPPRFNGALPTSGSRTLWLPLSARAVIMRSTDASLRARDTTILQSFARLAAGVSPARANAAVRVLGERAALQMTPHRRGGARETDVVALRGDTSLPETGNAVMIATVYGSMAFLILLVACTNVSALVVGAAVARRHEIAVRLSLGASRLRVIRQLLTESMMLALAGGSIGLVLYWWITSFVAVRVPDVDLSPDLATVAFTMCFALGTGILFGISPALHATRRGVSEVLKGSGGTATERSRLQRGFVVAQIVLTQPLLVGIAMFLSTLLQDGARQPRNEVAERVILLRLRTFAAAGSYQTKNAALQQMVARVAGAPGVEGVVPDAVGSMNADFTTMSDDAGSPVERTVPVHVEVTGPGYFALLGVPLLRGRDLVPADTGSADLPVVIGSDLAHELWGNADPIGRRFSHASRSVRQTRDAVVVGVFDARYSTSRGAGTRVYAPWDGRLVDAYLVRSTGPAAPLVQSIRAVVHAEVPNFPIGYLETLAQFNETNRAVALRVSGGAAAGGMLALLLASIGLYGVVAIALGQRRREIGIRMALGARPQQVVGMLFAGGVKLSVLGLALGLPLSVLALKVLAAQVRLPAIDMPLIGVAIASAVLGVASFATWLPARRAAAVNPVEALRAD